MGQHLHPLEQLGAPYRAVKAFRALLFTPAAGIAANPLLAELPPSLTLHHLFSRWVAEGWEELLVTSVLGVRGDSLRVRLLGGQHHLCKVSAGRSCMDYEAGAGGPES